MVKMENINQMTKQHLWPQLKKKIVYALGEHDPGSAQKGRNSIEMYSPAFNILYYPLNDMFNYIISICICVSNNFCATAFVLGQWRCAM